MSDERTRALEISLRQLRVASALLIDEYERVQKTGQF